MARSLVDALLAERAGYANRGLVDRVAQIDAALRELGFESTPTVEAAAVAPSAERAVTPRARKRRV